MSYLPMRVDIRDAIRVAKNQNWTVEQLNECMTSVRPALVSKLLDGSAIISEVFDDGSFCISIPGSFKGD